MLKGSGQVSNQQTEVENHSRCLFCLSVKLIFHLVNITKLKIRAAMFDHLCFY